MNDWEESSHGRWGYAEALGRCCDPGSLPEAVRARERKERHQLLDTFPVLKSPFRTDTRARRGTKAWDGVGLSTVHPIFLHFLARSYFGASQT